MNIRDAFPSNWLKASDLPAGKIVTVVIERVEMAKMPDDSEKLAIHFKGKDKALIANITNTGVIAANMGSDETDDWLGRDIQIYSTKVDFKGKQVAAIRVKSVEPELEEAGEDDIPF